MRRGMWWATVALIWLLSPKPVEAGIMCTWFGRCLYESPGFQITVVDKETGKPLADVHALAEWVQNGLYGLNGPLMVQDAVSSPDGILALPAWGPVPGSPAGLVINSDPVVTLFKPGYKVLLLNNAVPIGTHETDRVRGFSLGIQSPALEPFRGTSEEWVMELSKAAYPPRLGGTSEDQITQFRVPYLNRKLRVRAEQEKVAEKFRNPGQLFWHIERDIKFLQEGGR